MEKQQQQQPLNKNGIH